MGEGCTQQTELLAPGTEGLAGRLNKHRNTRQAGATTAGGQGPPRGGRAPSRGPGGQRGGGSLRLRTVSREPGAGDRVSRL